MNPFSPNSIVIPSLFAGRKSQIHGICKKLTGVEKGMPSSFFLYGERGIGKTALAKLIFHIAKLKDQRLYNLNLATSYYAVEKEQEISSILEGSLNKLTDNIDKSIFGKLSSRLGGLLKEGKFQIGAFGVTAGAELSKNGKGITIKDQTVSILSNIIRSLREGSSEGREKQRGILIIVDEMHNLKNIEDAASIFRNIITTLDVENFGNIAFLLVGYEEDMQKFFSQDFSSRRHFDLIQLDVMPENEAEDVLKKGFESIGVGWEEEQLKKNINIAAGYPHSIQILGHNLVKSDSKKYIDKTVWNAAIFDTALELRTKDFSNMYSFDKPLNQKDEILLLLVNENKALLKKEIANKFKFNIYQNLPFLIKKGAIKINSQNEVELQSRLLRTAILIDQFLRKNK